MKDGAVPLLQKGEAPEGMMLAAFMRSFCPPQRQLQVIKVINNTH